MKDALKKLLSDGILQDIPLVNDQYNLLVEEPDNRERNGLSEFTIVDLPADSIVFSLDYRLAKGKIKQQVANSRIKNFSWLIDERLINVNQKCDIIIISPNSYKERDLIIVGELKSKLSRNTISRARRQLKNSEIVLDLIFTFIQKHGLGEISNYVFKKVVFSNDAKAKNLNQRFHPGITNEEAIKYVFVENGRNKHWKNIEDTVY